MNLDLSRSFIERQSERLYQESILHRFISRFRFKGRCLFPDDRVKVLNGRPLGMFFYNLRAIFLGGGLIFLITLGLWAWLLPTSYEVKLTTAVLAFAWLADTAVTLWLHKSFIKNLGKWAEQRNPNEFPPLFNRYFVLDSVIVLLLVATGVALDLGHDAFAFLLFANVVVYSAYFPTVRRISRVIAILFSISLLLVLVIKLPVDEASLFNVVLYAGPLFGTTFVIVLSVLMISRLRTIEHDATVLRLELLGAYEDKLRAPDPAAAKRQSRKAESDIGAQQFRKQMARVLQELCDLDDPTFWYRSACLWFVEGHQDRGRLLMPAAWCNFPEAEQHRLGISSAAAGLLNSEEMILTHSMKCERREYSRATADDFHHDVDAPAAFVPLLRGEDRAGVLALYGEEGGPPLQRQDEAFLKSLGSIISTTLEQWEGLYKAQPQGAMDELFTCDSLDEVFKKTAGIMRKYLGAAGCMVIFRPDPAKKEMHIAAKIGFSDSVLKTNKYEVGKGLTGKCAETGKAIRIDDVPSHLPEFDDELLEGLEKAHLQEHGKPIVSWMAIPIGTKTNYGVIKVVNRKVRSEWFSGEDQALGLSLALRLQVLIEKFLYIEKIERAMEELKAKTEEAQRQGEEAKRQSEQRHDDLMVTMHQLQGPLASMLGSVSYIKNTLVARGDTKLLPKDAEEELMKLEDFVKDSQALSYGTFTTFALEAGNKSSFDVRKIDAPRELEKLAGRLQRTSGRKDLTFSFFAEENFPILRMDRRVFTSVLYSLIHNATKYADQHSEVSFVCGTELRTGEPVLKVKSVGEPIGLGERDSIFEKFHQGKVVKQTGRHHGGVGLGLWVARQLMKMIGGDLTVELSASNPRLSVFVVHIPKSNGAAA